MSAHKALAVCQRLQQQSLHSSRCNSTTNRATQQRCMADDIDDDCSSRFARVQTLSFHSSCVCVHHSTACCPDALITEGSAAEARMHMRACFMRACGGRTVRSSRSLNSLRANVWVTPRRKRARSERKEVVASHNTRKLRAPRSRRAVVFFKQAPPRRSHAAAHTTHLPAVRTQATRPAGCCTSQLLCGTRAAHVPVVRQRGATATEQRRRRRVRPCACHPRRPSGRRARACTPAARWRTRAVRGSTDAGTTKLRRASERRLGSALRSL